MFSIVNEGETTYLAVAEKCVDREPNVYIYEWPSLKLYRILRKGTEKGYACVQFSPHQAHEMATLGTTFEQNLDRKIENNIYKL